MRTTPTLADDILAKRLSVAPGLVDVFECVRTSIAAEGEAVARFSVKPPKLQPPAPVGWLEWDDGIVLALWWRCRDDQLIDICCFHRTAKGEAAIACALAGYRIGSAQFDLTYSADIFKDEAHAVAAASDYLNIFAVASALLDRKG